MPTSRKQSKHAGRFLEAILGICLLSGCVSSTAVSTASPPSTDTAASVSAYVGTKITCAKDAAVYRSDRQGMQECGTAAAGSFYDIDSQSGSYLHIADSSFYLAATAVQDSGRWFRNDSRLLRDASHVLVTRDSYQIEDVQGSVQLQVQGTDTYDIYVQPSGEDPRYGIRLQNGIFYIPADAVDHLEEANYPEEESADSLPVLMYHFFYSKANGESASDSNWLEVNDFQAQLQLLQEEGWSALTMREVLYFMQGRAEVPAKSLAITIDDNDPSVHTYAYPLLKQYGLHACIFLICGWEDPTLSWENWEMREDGLELQSHGFLMHQGGCSGMGHGGRLLCVEEQEGIEDTIRSFEYVDGGFVYCYPFGDVNEHAESIVSQAGAKLAFTTAWGRISPDLDPLRLPRIRVSGEDSLARFEASLQE